MLNPKSSFTVRILTSVKDKVRAESKRTGESINAIVERRLLESYRASEVVESSHIYDAMADCDKRPFLDGHSWGPGFYTCTCFKCKKSYMGEKRSSECASCAYDD